MNLCHCLNQGDVAVLKYCGRPVLILFIECYYVSVLPMVQPPVKGAVAIPNTYFWRDVCLGQLLFALIDLYKLHSWLVAQMPGKAV